MIGFRIGDTWLDMPQDLNLQVEIRNPLFHHDTIPSSFTFPFDVPAESKVNQLALQFAGLPSMSKYKSSFDSQMYVQNLLYKLGKLNVIKKANSKYSLNFQTDVGDIASLIKEDSLQELDLGIDNLVLQPADAYPLSKYALFPVKNEDFFARDNPSYCGYVNYYHNNAFGTNNSALITYAVTPFPYLVYILERVFASYGYQVTGDWLSDPEVRRLVIYNTRDLNLGNGTGALDTNIVFNRHVPDMKVNEFLKAIRTLLGIGFVFNPNARIVKVVRLGDVLLDPEYVDLTESVAREREWLPVLYSGFTLKQSPDTDDAVSKAQEEFFLTYKIGAGKEEIKTEASTLPMYRGEDRNDPNQQKREWLVPEASQKGSSSTLTIGINKFSLRLLSYQGMHPNSEGNLYPLGTSGSVDYAGSTISGKSLEWSGAAGLYQAAHKSWLDFRAGTQHFDTEFYPSMAELQRLQPERKVLIRYQDGTIKAIWDKITLNIDSKSGAVKAKAALFKTPF